MVRVKKHHPPFSAASSLGSDHFAHCKDRFQDLSRLDHTLFRSTRDHSSSSPAAPPKLPALAAPVPGRFPDAPRCSFSTPNLLKHRFYPASSLPSNIPCACGAVTVLFNPCSTPWFRRARHVVQLDHNYHRGNVSPRRNPVCHAVSFTCVVGSLLTSARPPEPRTVHPVLLLVPSPRARASFWSPKSPSDVEWSTCSISSRPSLPALRLTPRTTSRHAPSSSVHALFQRGGDLSCCRCT